MFMPCADCEDKQEESWKNYLSESENDVAYDLQVLKRAAAETEIKYKQDRPVDAEVQYLNGKIITHHEAPLEDGLLGYTDTKSSVYITTENRYGHSKQQILDHEHLHILHPEWDEYTLRTVTDHNNSIDIGLEQRESEKRNDSISYYIIRLI